MIDKPNDSSKMWNTSLDWIQNLTERNAFVRNFNVKAKESYITGLQPMLMKCSISRGCKDCRHHFSNRFRSGFRVQVLAGRSLTKDETETIGRELLSDAEFVRRLVALGWDTFEVHSDNGRYGLRWKIINYTNIND